MCISDLYKERFNPEELSKKSRIWKVLCQKFFQKYVNIEGSCLDLGGGHCDFINNIQCKKKYVLDIRNITSFAKEDVKVFVGDGKKLSMFKNNSLDVVFASNFFEHLMSKDDLLMTLKQIKRVLKQRGKLIILQPNVKYAYKEYWDFFDHHLPLSHKSMLEALNLAEFSITEIRSKFLPYTVKSSFPKGELFIKLYLLLPLLHKIFGKQMLIIAEKG